jgi:putative intracellular protease/amidase
LSIQAAAIVVHEGVQALDVAGPVDVFAEANAYVDSTNRYETTLVGATRDMLRA